MILSNRNGLKNTRNMLRVFGGLNETYSCTEAEYSAGINFSARNFPVLSTRLPRRKLREEADLNGMYHLNGLLTVCGRDLVYTPDDTDEMKVTLKDAVEDGRKTLVGIGTRILIFPDKLAFDTASRKVSALGAVWSGKNTSVEFAPCDAEGKVYEVSGCGPAEPDKPTDGQLFLRVEDPEKPWSSESTLEVYSKASGNWSAVVLDYCRISAKGVGTDFAAEDTVTLTGSAAEQAGQWNELDGRYYLHLVRGSGEAQAVRLLVYDTERGLWQEEDVCSYEMAGSGGQLYLWDGKAIWAADADREENWQQAGGIEDGVSFELVSGDIGLDSPEELYLSRLTLRLEAGVKSRIEVAVSYDSGAWETLAQLTADGRRCFDVPLVPRRCGSLRFRLKGRGQLTLRSLTRTSAAAKGGILAQEVN